MVGVKSSTSWPKSTDAPINFERKAYKQHAHPKIVPLHVANNTHSHHAQFSVELNHFKAFLSAQLHVVQSQLQSVQSHMRSLASQQAIQQLQQTMAQPNTQLQGQMSHLQQSIEKMTQHTVQKTWMTPKSVERYFRLVAIQGFSDGMHAIIEVDGHQTALSAQQICPVCRGWVLQRMNFAAQNAVFSKHIGSRILYVKLQAK